MKNSDAMQNEIVIRQSTDVRHPLLALKNISKSFGPVQAISDLDIELQPGEIHAVLGENGAGKTTLMRIIAGLVLPDQGQISIRGEPTILRNRGEGVLQGIGLVQQHYGLVHELSGTDNFLLGDPRVGKFLRKSGARKALLAASEKFELAVDPDRPIGALSIGERQRLEILIALASGADILIFDEPTAALTRSDVEHLIAVMKRLALEGKAIAYVTHKLREVTGVANRVTVVRRGKLAGRFDRSEMTESALTKAMIGATPTVKSVPALTAGNIVLQLRDVCVDAPAPEPGLKDFNLELRAGEVVGVAGVDGSGQLTLAEVAAGRQLVQSGKVETIPDVIGYIPEDRARDGLANVLSLAENSIVHRSGDPSLKTLGALSSAKIASFTKALLDRGNVVAGDISLPASSLSGGNQQKLVVARELERKPALIVAHNPYRGLDLGAAAEVRARLLEEAQTGSGVLLISPDLDDLFQLASKIIVLSNGSIVGSVDPKSTSAEELGTLIGGAADA